MGIVKAGARAPSFSLHAEDGSTVSLGDFAGRKLVLYFFPGEGETCVAEACGFRDHWAAVRRTGAALVGVSPGDERSLTRFRARHRLPFPLLADPEHAAARAYGVWARKQFMGRRYIGILRTTFVIDEAARVARVFEKVRARGHAEAVLAALKDVGRRGK